jgi:hypothetical protein
VNVTLVVPPAVSMTWVAAALTPSAGTGGGGEAMTAASVIPPVWLMLASASAAFGLPVTSRSMTAAA